MFLSKTYQQQLWDKGEMLSALQTMLGGTKSVNYLELRFGNSNVGYEESNVRNEGSNPFRLLIKKIFSIIYSNVVSKR